MTREVSVADLSVTYGDVVAMHDASLVALGGQITGILGPNGSGKTSLMKGMLGLVRRASGTVDFSGKSLSRVRAEVAYVPQRKEIDWDFPITVADTVLMGTFPKLGPFKPLGTPERKAAQEALDQVGMTGFEGRQIGELSGGQQQRVFIARALAQDPSYLFLDEPFTGVDVRSAQVILEALARERRRGVATLIVDHDLGRAQNHFDHVILVDHQVVADGPPKEVLTPNTIAEVYLSGETEQTKGGDHAVPR